MQTKILDITPESLALAKEILVSGGLVAFPTETVYGLGASAFDDDAVASIFAVKCRPADNPLIAHVHRDYDISSLIDYDPPYAAKLRAAFLPGPLTLVYRSTHKVSPRVSCGLDTLSIRVPSHAGAQAFLRYVDLPVVAPSANLSKHVSPVSSAHVFGDLGGKIPLILEGGRCTGGIESTVCDVTGDIPLILRAGLVTREMIASVAGDCGVYVRKEGEKPRSPGMAYRHYSPRCRTRLFPSDGLEALLSAYWEESESARAYILCEGVIADTLKGFPVLNLGYTGEEMAANLYELLREGEQKADVILALEPRGKGGVMVGVLNRLTRACGGE